MNQGDQQIGCHTACRMVEGLVLCSQRERLAAQVSDKAAGCLEGLGLPFDAKIDGSENIWCGPLGSERLDGMERCGAGAFACQWLQDGG